MQNFKEIKMHNKQRKKTKKRYKNPNCAEEHKILGQTKKLGLTTLEERRKAGDLIKMYKVTNR